MHTTIHHLPASRQRHIQRILDMIGCDIPIEKIILFGCFAEGHYTEHRFTDQQGELFEFISDYNMLIVISNLANVETMTAVLESKKSALQIPVNFLVCRTMDMQESINNDWHFFADIARNAILLYDANAEAIPGTTADANGADAAKKESDFKFWFHKAMAAKQEAALIMKQAKFPEALLLLHNAAQCLYLTMLTVHWSYLPVHTQLLYLRNLSKNLSPELYFVFRIEQSARDLQLFEQLQLAGKHLISIEPNEMNPGNLEAIQQKINKMAQIVADSCGKTIG